MERESLLDQYRRGPDALRDAVEGLDATQIHFRPSLPDAWTIAEHICHVFDAEANAFIRYRRAIAEPGSTVSVYDENLWTQKLRYGDGDMETALDAFTLIREITYNHLLKISQEDWGKYWYQHPDRGKETLDKWLEVYAKHADFHIEYIQRNKKLAAEGGAKA